MLLIIDGDVQCYHACTPAWEFKKKADAQYNVVSLDDEGVKKPIEFTADESRRYMEQSWKNFQNKLVEMQETFFTEDYLMAVKGPHNYRDMLYPDYKLKRGASPKPSIARQFVPTLRKLAVVEEIAIESIGREADDLIRIWANQAAAAGIEYVICSVDKDLKCIPGKHYNMKTKEITDVSPEMALRHYYAQLIAGDPTDNIPGIPGVAMITALKHLAPFNTEQEFQEVVAGNYLNAYGEDWIQFLLSNGKMIHIQNHEHDFFSVNDWEIVKELR